VNKKIKPAKKDFKHRQDIETFQDLVIALQFAFNHGFDEGPHWAQVSLRD
jgi:hypothetical protein